MCLESIPNAEDLIKNVSISCTRLLMLWRQLGDVHGTWNIKEKGNISTQFCEVAGLLDTWILVKE